MANFQKWVKNFNGVGYPYNHLASFKKIARELNKFMTFGLTLEE